MDNQTLPAEQDTSGSAKFVMHRPSYTPSERLGILRAKQLRDGIKAAAAARKAPPAVVIPIRAEDSFGPVIIRWVDPLDRIFGPIVCRKDPEALRPSCKEIIKATAQYFDIPKIDILSSRRTAHVVRPRQVAVYLCRTLTTKSLPFIGRELGDRDHTTCLHSVRVIQGELCAGNAAITEAIDYLTEKLGGRPTV